VERYPPIPATRAADRGGRSGRRVETRSVSTHGGKGLARRPDRIVVATQRTTLGLTGAIGQAEGGIRRRGMEAREGPKRPAPERRRLRRSDSAAAGLSTPYGAPRRKSFRRRDRVRRKYCAAVCSKRRRNGGPISTNRRRSWKKRRRKSLQADWPSSPPRHSQNLRARLGRRADKEPARRSPLAVMSAVYENSASPPRVLIAFNASERKNSGQAEAQGCDS